MGEALRFSSKSKRFNGYKDARLHCGRSDVAVLFIVLHRGDEVLVAGHLGLEIRAP
jgi:hypothetical protein